MTSQSLRAKRFAVRSLLLAAILLPGCGTSIYTIPPAELQRLTQLPPSQRGDHVRAFTPDVVPKNVAPPSQPVALPNPPPVAPVQQPVLTPPPPEMVATAELPPDPFGPDEIDLPEPPMPGIVVAVDAGPRAPAHPSTAQARPSPPARTPPPAAARTSVPPPAPGRIATPSAPARASVPTSAPSRIATPSVAGRASVPPAAPGHFAPPAATPHLPVSPVRTSVPVSRPTGGRLPGSSHSFHSGGGSPDAVVGAVVAVVLLVGLIAVIAEASQPGPSFDGWVRTSPEHPVRLAYGSGREREVRLCDLQPADLVGVRAATLYDADGIIERLETAADQPPAVSQPFPAPAPAPARPPAPATPPTRPAAPPPVPRAASPSAPLSCVATFDRAA